VQASLRVRDLVIASWETDRESAEGPLPAGVEAAEVDGRFLVSLVAFRVEGGRLGRAPVLPYAQLNVRTYAARPEEPAVFFLASRVTVGGLPGALLGAPFRLARLRVRRGSVRAPGLGISLRYSVGEGGEPGPLGRHELGLFESDGLRAVRIRRGTASWQRAALTEPAQADFLVALGFELRGEPELLYAERTVFDADVPLERA
jgi:Uncharacterized conserved protein (COG2071)